MERRVLTSPGFENVATSENTHLRSQDESDRCGSLQHFSQHIDQRGPSICAETHDDQKWRSTVKNNEINEVQALLEQESEKIGLASSPARQSDANKPHEENDYDNASTDGDSDSKTDQQYDVNQSTRLQCIVGVFVGCFLALACIASGIYVLATRKEKLALHVDIDTTTREILSLVFNIILTFCIDSMAFIHSVSLRWSLYSEQRLEFNTNLRLFTSSTKSGPNRWYTNIFSMICLVFCYGASSYLLLPFAEEVFLNGVALVVLGLALLGHAAVSTWCLWTRSDSVLTWSSNPLSNCLAAVQKGMIQRREGRCMQPVPHHNHSPSKQLCGNNDDMEPVHAQKKQNNIYSLHKRIRTVLGLLWTLAILATIWVFTILGVGLAFADPDSGFYCPHGTESLKWEIVTLGSCESNTASLSMSLSQHPDEDRKLPLLQVFLGLLFITAVQAAQSIGLHCTELLVNISRDESLWRKAYDGIGNNKKCPKGSLLASDSLTNAIKSWEYITLSIFKSLLHWSVGQAMQPTIIGELAFDDPYMDSSSLLKDITLAGITFYMTYTRLILYAALAILLASFATFLALRKRSGPQPATMGHLQTIADMVDDWTPNEKGRIFWGDKGADVEAGIRHAGTSSDPKALDKISLDAVYAA